MSQRHFRRLCYGVYALTALFALSIASACAPRDSEPKQAPEQPPVPAAVDTQAPPAAEPKALPAPVVEHLEHVHQVRPDVISGAQPEDAAAFAELAALGVKTILSVDGAMPDAEAARAHGMRYIHVPIQYAGIKTQRRAELIAALRDCERPIYVHCHHGLHRGPAATAYALVSLGEMTEEAGLQFLKDAGTSPSYPGLFTCVRDAGSQPTPEGADAIDGAGLPERSSPGGMAEGMAAIDEHWSNIKLIEAAGWVTPPDHPDLVPLVEAGIVHDHFRALEAFDDGPVAILQAIRHSGQIASALEEAIRNEDVKQRQLSFGEMVQACNACHKRWRNN